MNDTYVIARKAAVIDLIATAREAADVLRQRGASVQELAIADALDGAAAEIATDLSEPVLS